MTDTTIPVSSIIVPKTRIREVDPDWVAVLAADISERDLVHPIAVTKTDDGYRLISGAHRLGAFNKLGRDEIPARILDQDETHARLSEIMENMIRNPLTALERARSLYEIDRLYKALFPDMKKGGNAQVTGEKNRSAILAVRSDILDKVGLSQRSFERGMAIWKSHLSQLEKASLAIFKNLCLA